MQERAFFKTVLGQPAKHHGIHYWKEVAETAIALDEPKAASMALTKCVELERRATHRMRFERLAAKQWRIAQLTAQRDHLLECLGRCRQEKMGSPQGSTRYRAAELAAEDFNDRLSAVNEQLYKETI